MILKLKKVEILQNLMPEEEGAEEWIWQLVFEDETLKYRHGGDRVCVGEVFNSKEEALTDMTRYIFELGKRIGNHKR